MSPSAPNDQGVFQDTIAKLSEPLSSLSTIPPLVAIVTLTYKAKTPSSSRQRRLSSVMYTLANLVP